MKINYILLNDVRPATAERAAKAISDAGYVLHSYRLAETLLLEVEGDAVGVQHAVAGGVLVEPEAAAEHADTLEYSSLDDKLAPAFI